MLRLQNLVAPETWRLLRVLFLRLGALPAGPGNEPVLLLEIGLTRATRATWRTEVAENEQIKKGTKKSQSGVPR